MLKEISAIALFALVSTSAPCAELKAPPAEIEFNGKTFKLSADEESKVNYIKTFRYLSDGDTTDNMSKSISIEYEKVILAEPEIWAAIFSNELSKEIPKPTYRVFVKDKIGYARIIFEPSGNKQFFESVAVKSFHITNCGDVVVTLKASEKYTFPTGKSFEEKRAMVMKIYPENEGLLKQIGNIPYEPSCKQG